MYLKKQSSIRSSKLLFSRFCRVLLTNVVVFGILLSTVSNVNAVSLADYPKLQAVADELIAEKHYTQAQLDEIFSHAVVKQSVLDAMTSPAEYKFTWGKYRKLFLQEDRIQQGAEFWLEHQEVFDRAEKEYGVPSSVIAAIVGVESKFGKFKGKHKVIDSLVSLVVGFPRRSKFFAGELKEFLILTNENKLDFNAIKGSYAGAVGYPQFISSSYRNYAVDFSGDGIADLINEPHDAIGSIANYFVKNGWLTGQPVTSQSHQSIPSELKDIANRKRKIQFTASELKARSGDTICKIAEKFEVPCKELIALNSINKKGDIFRGQRLKLPAVEVAEETKSEPVKTNSSTSRWEIGGKKAGSVSTATRVTSTKNNESDKKKVETGNTQAQPIYFYTHENFYVITRYNQSVLYAMAVHDLSQEIALAKAKLDAQPKLKLKN